MKELADGKVNAIAHDYTVKIGSTNTLTQKCFIGIIHSVKIWLEAKTDEECPAMTTASASTLYTFKSDYDADKYTMTKIDPKGFLIMLSHIFILGLQIFDVALLGIQLKVQHLYRILATKHIMFGKIEMVV